MPICLFLLYLQSLGKKLPDNFSPHFSSLKFKVAEQWCSLGMRFLKHLSQHKESYEEQVNCVKSIYFGEMKQAHAIIHWYTKQLLLFFAGILNSCWHTACTSDWLWCTIWEIKILKDKKTHLCPERNIMCFRLFLTLWTIELETTSIVLVHYEHAIC